MSASELAEARCRNMRAWIPLPIFMIALTTIQPWAAADLPPAPGQLIVRNNLAAGEDECTGNVTTHYGYRLLNRMGGPVLRPGDGCSIDVFWQRSATTGYTVAQLDLHLPTFAYEEESTPIALTFGMEVLYQRTAQGCPDPVEETSTFYDNSATWYELHAAPIAWTYGCSAYGFQEWTTDSGPYLYGYSDIFQMYGFQFQTSHACVVILGTRLTHPPGWDETYEISCNAQSSGVPNPAYLLSDLIGTVDPGETFSVDLPLSFTV